MDKSRQAIFRNGVVAAGAAAAVNLALFGAVKAGGVDFAVDAGPSPTTVTASQVVASSVIPIILGSAVAVLVRRRDLRRIEVLAMAITLLSLGGPLSMGVGVGTKLTLAALHLVTGAAFVTATRRATRRRELGAVQQAPSVAGSTATA